MCNYNKIYHKGEFRSGEWVQHLRPYLKRVGNKRWRKTGKAITGEEEKIRTVKTYAKKRTIRARIKMQLHGGEIHTYTRKYRTLRDAHNAMKQARAISGIILDN